MIIRNFYFHIILRVLLVVVLSTGIGLFISSGKPVSLIFIVSCLDIVMVFILIKFINSTNRKISYFLESVQNDDSTLSIPHNITDKSILGIYEGLNKVNRQIQQLKIESRQQEQYFEALLEHVATGILTYNSKGFVLHANSSVKKMFGVEILTHLNQLERINRNLFQSIKNIGPFEQRLISVNSERGMVQLSLKSTSFKVKNDELILLSIQDIRNELDEKELDSWMKLIRVLMHEIMNSIAPITSLSESLCNFFTVDGRPALPDELSESKIQATLRGLSVIKEQGNGLMLFVESYRKLTRLPKPDKKLFRFEELATRIKVLYSSLENSELVKLVVTINPHDLELFADENLISQVLLNLTKNALQANEKNPEGRIQIIAGINKDRRLEVRVIDNGPGIPEDILEQVFVPFFTTKESGSGIGLSLSRQIMRLHGGSLQARSIPGKETVFSMTF